MPQKIKPLPPDSATILERSRGLFFAQWEELLRIRRVVLKSSDLDDIHDLRVASRRFRALLNLFYPFLPEAGREELKKNVRKITRTLGGLRNIDEAQIFFKSRSTEMPNYEIVCLELSSLRAGELQRIVKSLKSFDRHSLDHSVRKMISGLHDKIIVPHNRFSLLTYLFEASIRHYMPIHKSLAAVTQPEHYSARHALRIAIKKWRYFFEIVEQILNCDYTGILDQLREYQTLLGQMNDIREFEVLLGSLKISKADQRQITKIFAQEEADLLHRLAQLIEQKPLAYTFLI